MKIYTKAGDQGKTGYLGKGKLSKSDPRIHAYGTVDELNSVLGMVILDSSTSTQEILQLVQNKLFDIGAELASDEPLNRISEVDITKLEEHIDKHDAELSPLKSFILPGGSKAASWLHIGRTVARRAERWIVELSESVQLNPHIIPYANRLSDLLFVLARFENHKNNVKDIEWVSQ